MFAKYQLICLFKDKNRYSWTKEDTELFITYWKEILDQEPKLKVPNESIADLIQITTNHYSTKNEKRIESEFYYYCLNTTEDILGKIKF